MQPEHRAFLVDFLPFERRKLSRTGINLHCLQYWADPLAPWIGETVDVHYDPRDITLVHVRGPSGVVVTASVTTPDIPAISLVEWQSRRLGERAFSRDPQVQAEADAALLRGMETVKGAKQQRGKRRRQATQAAGDAWRRQSAPTASDAPTKATASTPLQSAAATESTLYKMEF